MASASCAHIWAYWASVAAIAGVFCPKKLVAINDINRARLAATTAGGTVSACAVSKAPAASLAWPAAHSACAAMVFIHVTYGAAAAAIRTAEGPCHGPSVTPEITDGDEAAVQYKSAASPPQAVTAPIMGPDPGPAYISPELISCGSIPKNNAL